MALALRALALRGFILGAPKPSRLQIPIFKSYQQQVMTMLQKQPHGLKHSRKISHSLIKCGVNISTDIGKGHGSKVNEKPTQEVNPKSSSSKSERTGNKSKGEAEANATPQKTGANQTG